MQHTLADVHHDEIAAIWLNVYRSLRSKVVGRGMLVCKTFEKLLPPLVKEITLFSSEISRSDTKISHILDQDLLSDLAHKFHSITSLTIYQEYDDHNPVVDWSQVVLPHLQQLDLNYCPLSSIDFNMSNTPALKSLGIEHAGHDAQNFRVELPDLVKLYFRFATVSHARFAIQKKYHRGLVWPKQQC